METRAAGDTSKQQTGRVLVFRRPTWMTGSALSAALAAALAVAVIGGVWSFAGKLRLEKRLDQALSTQVALAESEEASRERLAAEGTRRESVAQELEAERLRSSELERELDELRTNRGGLADGMRSTIAVASVWLTPGMLRGGGELERLIVPAEAGLVELMLDIGIDDYASYRAVLRDTEGDEIWSQSKLDAGELDARVAVEVTLPANLLPVGDYSLHLSGKVGERDYELLGRYYFRVLPD